MTTVHFALLFFLMSTLTLHVTAEAYIALYSITDSKWYNASISRFFDCTDTKNFWPERFSVVESNMILLLFSDKNCTGPYLKYPQPNTLLDLSKQASEEEKAQYLIIKSWVPITTRYLPQSIRIDTIPTKQNNTLGQRTTTVVYNDVCDCTNLNSSTYEVESVSYMSSDDQCVTIYTEKGCTGFEKEIPKEITNNVSMTVNSGNDTFLSAKSFKPCVTPRHCRLLTGYIQQFKFMESDQKQILSYSRMTFLNTSLNHPGSGKKDFDLQKLAMKSFFDESLIHKPAGFQLLHDLKLNTSAGELSPKLVFPPALADSTWLDEFVFFHKTMHNYPNITSNKTNHYIGPSLKRNFSLKKNVTLKAMETVGLHVFINFVRNYTLNYSVFMNIRGEWGNTDDILASEIKWYLLLNDHMNLNVMEILDEHTVLAYCNCSVVLKFAFSTVFNITKL